ncbi:MAG: hypothetical protein WCA08_10465 [Desulfoferrobacter sp.]
MKSGGPSISQWMVLILLMAFVPFLVSLPILARAQSGGQAVFDARVD